MPTNCVVCQVTRPCFAPVNDPVGLRCGGCRVKGDVDVVSRKCETCNEKNPSFAPAGGRAVRCNDCRVEGDVNVVSKKCIVCDDKQSSFAPKSSKRPLRCATCKLDGDRSMTGARCQCARWVRPSFGPKGGKAVRCSTCQAIGDVNVVARMCQKCDVRQAGFSPGGSRPPLRCGGCSVDGDEAIRYNRTRDVGKVGQPKRRRLVKRAPLSVPAGRLPATVAELAAMTAAGGNGNNGRIHIKVERGSSPPAASASSISSSGIKVEKSDSE
jgi:hypothetical protein